MAPPPVSIYVTSLTSQPKVRQNIELLRRGLEIPYTEHDLVMDEEAKTRWQRAKPSGQVIGLPGYLVGGEYIGNMDDFEYASETATLETFLRQNTDLAANQSIGEAELESLMREMSDADLDALALEVGKGDSDKDKGEKPEEVKADKSVKEDTEVTKSTKSPPAPIDTKKAEGSKGVSSAAESTISTIAQKAAELIEGLGGKEAHTGTSDDPRTPSSTTTTFTSVGDSGKYSSSHLPHSSSTNITHSSPFSSKPVSSPEVSSSSPEPELKTGRRMSKQEIADEMLGADSVDKLMESLGLASGKSGKEKEKAE